MEPLVAFAAAGNVLQFVQLGIKITNNTLDFIQRGQTDTNESIHNLTQHLAVASDQLRQALELDDDFDGTPGPRRSLLRANETCLRMAMDLLELLSSLKVKGEVTTWSSFKASVKSMRARDRVDQLARKLQEARSNLMLTVLIYNAQTRSRNSAIPPTVRYQLDELGLGDVRTSSSLQFDIKQLADVHTSTKTTEQGFDDRFEVCVSAHRSELADTQRKLKDMCVRRTLASLRFPEIWDRRSAITEACEGTFNWMFDNEDATDIAWDNFLEWLHSPEGSKMFWVRGKPGSGKSTLMRWVDKKLDSVIASEEISTEPDATVQWTHGCDFLVISYYFWYAGSTTQKSTMGLLRSLLYQLVDKNPALVYTCIPAKYRDEMALDDKIAYHEWSNQELVSAITDALSTMTYATNVLILIDGLDEALGTDTDREVLVEIFQEWSTIPNVKVCASSRPWNIYCDLFRGKPYLKLEDLTREDIMTFVNTKFKNDSLFSEYFSSQPADVKALTEDIVTKACGVFLWVRLAVNILIKQLRDGAYFEDLTVELRRLPSDLEEFFERMLESIDVEYRIEAVHLLQIAICDTSLPQDEAGGLRHMTLAPGIADESGILLYDVLHLTRSKDPFFCLSEAGRRLPQPLLRDVTGVATFDILLRRINSRSMGLLEVTDRCWKSGGPSSYPVFRFHNVCALRLFSHKVTVIHRTVNDYLLNASGQRLLTAFADAESYDAYAFHCNALTARFLAMKHSEKPLGLLRRLVVHLKTLRQDSSKVYALFKVAVSSTVILDDEYIKSLMDVYVMTETDEEAIEALSFILAFSLDWDDSIIHNMRGHHLRLFTTPFLTIINDTQGGIMFSRPPSKALFDHIASLSGDKEAHTPDEANISYRIELLH